jgi:high-affinity iron transporter
MWAGVVAALALCAIAAVALRLIGEQLPLRQRELMEGVLALVAVAGVSYMVVWMRRHSRELKGTLEAHAERALLTGSIWALIAMAFLAVIREGIETAVFLLAAFQASTNPGATGIGAIAGVLVAVALGYAIYRGAAKVNLSKFFRVTGFVLVLVAAGLLASAAHSLAEAQVLTVGQTPALNLTWLVRPGSVQASLLTGMLGLRPVPTVAEVFVWLAYAVPMGAYVLWPQRPRRRTAASATVPLHTS